VNEGHLVCDSLEWRAAVRDEIIPWAVRDVDLGDDVLEIGPGYGATRYVGTHVEVVLGDATQLTFPEGRFSGAVCFSMLHHVPSPELQNRLFAEAARVLRPGSPMIAVDGVESDGVRAFHEGDTYQPIDPTTLPARLKDAGFTDVEVRLHEYGWAAMARRT